MTQPTGIGLHVRLGWLALPCLFALTAGCGAPPTAGRPAPVERRPIAGGPVLLRDDIALSQLAEVGPGHIRLALDPVGGGLYLLHPTNGLSRLPLQPSASPQPIAGREIVPGGGAVFAGMDFGPDGRLYVVANQQVDRTHTRAVIRQGTPLGDDRFRWDTLAATDPYPLSSTFFDHLFNGVAVSPDGAWVFLNSGSRTDHGEVQSNGGAFPDLREAALTARILRLPADVPDQVLPNDEAALTAQGLIFARGTRNAYDPAFAPNGDLLAGDNGPDADFPDELNWLREGRHYGFPWRFGDQDNPQQFPGYDAADDPRLSLDFAAVQGGFYRDDPTFPPAPGPFTDPVANRGPDAALYRSADGGEADAAALGQPLYTFTPHRSPLGLVFVTSAAMPADLRPNGDGLSAFILSWGAAGGSFSDQGKDLLHLQLRRAGDDYEAAARQVARSFENPIDAVLIDNRLYVLEYGGRGAIWELAFE